MIPWVGEANREGSMRGEDRTNGALFSYVDIEARIPAKHALRAMRRLTNAALADLDEAFSALYETCGHPSTPAHPLRACSDFFSSRLGQNSAWHRCPGSERRALTHRCRERAVIEIVE